VETATEAQRYAACGMGEKLKIGYPYQVFDFPLVRIKIANTSSRYRPRMKSIGG